MSSENAKEDTKTTPPTSEAPEEKASSTASEPVTFPPPKYVVTIVSPRVIHLHESDASLDEWKEFETSRHGKNDDDEATTQLNLHVLLVSLLNRLLRARLFPRRAVHSYITPAAGLDDHEWVVFSILTPATVLPILLSKCEHFGVGNLVGLVYAVPLETCVLPVLHQTVEEEEEEGLLEVPSQFDKAPLGRTASSRNPDATASTKALALATAKSNTSMSETTVLVMPPKHRKTMTPDPAVLRPVVSESYEKPESELDLINSDGPEPGIPPPAPVQRSSSHPDVIQTAKVEDNKSDKKEATAKKQRETPILEMIPEAKTNANKDEKKDPVVKGSVTTETKSEKPNKSVLIEKVLDARKEWLATASRIRVEQVAEEVTAAAALTWDYLLFVVCAAAIAATGLATNSSVTVLASMLVSPIMGPVLAVTFGTMIQRPAMIKKALRNESISLLLCVIVGAFGGLVVWWTRLYESSDWPADEMIARGDPSGLAAGVFIALPSGMATALSTLGKNSSGLVGVAISLSLLPPAVNAGLCWMFALLEETGVVDKQPDDDWNYWRAGSTSLGLTLINIFCIWLAGVFTFWLKEVAPVEHKNAFWSRDLKIARQKKKDTGAGKIKDGLQAAIDLKKTYNVDVSSDHKTKTIKQRRRMTAPISRWEDALLLDENPTGTQIPETRIQRASSDGILEQTEVLGGFDSATDILFNNSLFRAVGELESDDDETERYRNGMDLSYHASVVPPEDIYQEILWQRLRNPKM